MITETYSGAITGVDASIIEVQCDMMKGLPHFKIVGLPEKEVQESRERIRSAIGNSGFEFPTKRITANLAPADVKKKGVGLDLPIAATILEGMKQIPRGCLQNKLLIGELTLDGRLRPVKGILPIVLQSKKRDEIESILLPEENAKEAAAVDALTVYPVSNLDQAVDFLENPDSFSSFDFDVGDYFKNERDHPLDFDDVKGQEQAKRALSIAGAGGHNVLMIGPPGSGKSMLAKRLPTVLPPLTFEESLEVTKIYSTVGKLPPDLPLITTRKVRAPHHTISYAGMVGGGHGSPRPGEISLAHNGILFLDELPEFSRRVLETLRQPLENGTISISRASGSTTFPANITLVAAMNPCPCGYLGDSEKDCRCKPYDIRRYRKKISGPFLDRVDIFIDVRRLETKKLISSGPEMGSSQLRGKVEQARKCQQRRFNGKGIYNAQMDIDQVERHCDLGTDGGSILEQAVDRFGFSARSYHKVLKVARTIADMAGSDKIKDEQVAEAVQYQTKREKFLTSEGV